MRVLFVSNYFPPEVNAPATRLYEHARQWVEDGHEVEVLTSVPNFPEGKVYHGYRNRYSEEVIEGIRSMRVPMYVAENKGTTKRTLSYLSFMLSAVWYARKAKKRPDVVVATSPQFFAAIGGFIISILMRRPFVLEIRDLWPESIVAVGAVRRNWMIRVFERIELFLYRKADHIVVVTNAFKAFIEEKGIGADKISVLKNGYDLATLAGDLDSEILASMRKEYGLEDKFVASYIGTVGMAHGVEVMLEAARRSTDPDVVFMVVGTGAERERLESLQAEYQLSNFRLIDKQPKERVRLFLALTDVSVVHLKESPLFRTVIPSKIFEAMAMQRPIALGVEGETKEIIEEANAGLFFKPEDPGALLTVVHRLRDDRGAYEAMATSGSAYVNVNHDRAKLARRYWRLLEDVTRGLTSSVSALETSA